MDFEFYCSLFSRYGLEITEEKYEKFEKYSAFLVEYNQKVNLTAITDPQEIVVKHFLDSCLLLKYADIPDGAALIDVGTGAGFPSVPLKIMRPDIKITLLDSLAKRITFLQKLCELIGEDADFIHGRAEDFGKMPEYREKFEAATARAVANMSLLSEFCLPFVKPGGAFFALKGHSEDISAGDNAVKLLGGEIVDTIGYELNGDKRSIVCVSKISQTPTKYPRNSAQIKKRAL
ncbi:MAG TPA: 16S rRNA (guanine(527)-N(7))-methyltransferase RsmG [Ruminococcus sp.]|nr:16S rRNA (guanine(527)-N(7))-methyltransferase RsmG [Ruminococcus sp.]